MIRSLTRSTINNEVWYQSMLVGNEPNSTAGQSWTQYNAPVASNDAQVSSIVWFNNKWVLVMYVSNSSQQVYNSTDGVTWTLASTLGVNLNLYATVAGSYVYLWSPYTGTGGNNATFYYSSDGSNFTSGTWNSLGKAPAFNGSVYVNVGTSGRTYAYSSNGTSWTTATNASFPTDFDVASYVIGNTIYAHGSGTSTIWTTTNGTTWTSTTNGVGTNRNGFNWVQNPSTQSVYIPNVSGNNIQIYKTTNGTSFTLMGTFNVGYSADVGKIAIRREDEYVYGYGTGMFAFRNGINTTKFGDYPINAYYPPPGARAATFGNNMYIMGTTTYRISNFPQLYRSS